MGEFVNSGSGDAENGGNVCHVHHQGQFFQRVILFLVHLVFFLPFWESKLVCEWPKRITQSKFFILFSSRRHGGWTRRLRNVDLRADAQSACKTAPVGTTRPTPRSKRLRRRAFLACAVVPPSTLRLQAALGSGFSLQAAFWYQNAMLALFLLRKKSLKRGLRLLPPFRTPHKI